MRIGIIRTGEMGSGVGGRLAKHGADVYTSFDGPSAASAERVRRAGIADVGNMNALVRTIVLSIVPPDQARGVAEAFARACDEETVTPAFIRPFSPSLLTMVSLPYGTIFCAIDE